MKKITFLIIFCVLTVLVSAQTANSKNIIDELNTIDPGQGRVTVYQDEAIKGIVGRSIAPPRPVYMSSDGSAFVKMRGFKIQAFSGNNQRTSKDEAYRKQQLINNAYPDLETVVLFESPVWRLRVGNFKSRAEAIEVMNDMRQKFTSFGKEMYIVTDEVKIPIDQL